MIIRENETRCRHCGRLHEFDNMKPPFKIACECGAVGINTPEGYTWAKVVEGFVFT